MRGAFGLTLESNIGQLQFPAVQAAPSFPDAFPHMFRGKQEVKCLIPCAIDQVRPHCMRWSASVARVVEARVAAANQLGSSGQAQVDWLCIGTIHRLVVFLILFICDLSKGFWVDFGGGSSVRVCPYMVCTRALEAKFRWCCCLGCKLNLSDI